MQIHAIDGLPCKEVMTLLQADEIASDIPTAWWWYKYHWHPQALWHDRTPQEDSEYRHFCETRGLDAGTQTLEVAA